MLRPRFRPLSSAQFLVCNTLRSQQVRYKSVKRLHKGDVPRKPKPPPRPSVQPNNAEVKAKEEKTAPVKKPRDPLQGMREANEEAKIIKYPQVAAAKAAESISSSTAKENSHAETIPRESKKHVPAAEDLTVPSGRPMTTPPNYIPPSSSSSSNVGGDRKWMFYAIAGTFAAGGAYLFLYGDSKPMPTSVLLSPSTINVNAAIKHLKKIFGERCSTSEDDLSEYGGAGIMSVGAGMKPKAVVFPTTTEEVEVILKIADDYSVPVIPYSGGTSLEGYFPFSSV